LLSCLLPRIQGRRSIASTAIPSTDVVDREEGEREDEAGPSGLVDLLLFNPPYVPTSEEEEALAQQDRSLSGSWAGGSLGTRLLHSLIDDAGRSITSPEAASDQQEEEEGGICSSEGETDTASPKRSRRRRRRCGGIESILSPQGHFYCVAIRQNDPQDIVRRLEARGLGAQVVLDRKAGREHLFIIRGSKKKV
jgi:release factor glutamine methyltransferase